MTVLRGRRGVPLASLVPVAAAVAPKPLLWPSAFGALVRLAPRRWWRRAPFLPVPDVAWWAFRMETAYGTPDAAPTAEDVVSYLRWCRATARLRAEPGAPTSRSPRTTGAGGRDAA